MSRVTKRVCRCAVSGATIVHAGPKNDSAVHIVTQVLNYSYLSTVQKEDRWWDEADGEDRETRRPDITAFNPRDRKRYVIDVVGAWSEVTSLDKAWARDGVMADVKAKAKWRSYDASLASQDTTGRGWLCGGKSKSTDVFVRKAFLASGSEAQRTSAARHRLSRNQHPRPVLTAQ